MGLLEKIKAKRNELIFESLVKMVCKRLSSFVEGMPLADGEAEMVVMLSPSGNDTGVFLVALDKAGQVKRVAAKYSGVELASMLAGKLSGAGIDLSSFTGGLGGDVEAAGAAFAGDAGSDVAGGAADHGLELPMNVPGVDVPPVYSPAANMVEPLNALDDECIG